MTTQDNIEVAIIGGGAIGGLLAAAAQAAGHVVTLCVRTPIRRLEIETGGKKRDVPVRIASDPRSLQPVPWVLLTTKAQDTEGAAAWLRRLTGRDTTVVVLQNGLEHEEGVRPLVGDATVVPALVHVSAERIAPGRIRHHGGDHVVVPEGETGRAFERLLGGGGGLRVVQEPDFITAAWRKLLSNVAANPITALTMRRIGVMRDPAVRDLARGLLEEAVAAGRAAGAQLTDKDVDDVLALYATLNESGGSSMLYDRLAGRSLEHEHLTGAVVRTAERHGIPVPLNRMILTLLAALDTGSGAVGSGGGLSPAETRRA